MKIKKLTITIGCSGLLLLSLLVNAWGHAAIVWAYVENNRVYVEAFYPSGSKIQNAMVAVIDKSGNTLLEGRTDKDGKFSYRPVSKEMQVIVVTAGESHVGDFELGEEELADITLD